MNKQKTLSIIIPVYNEVGTVEKLLDCVLAAPLSLKKELVIVNDGSTDGSCDVIEKWAAVHAGAAKIRCFSQPNGGKGAAVRTGIAHSTGDVVIIQDADLEYNPCDYEACAAPIAEGREVVVYGSRERYTANRANSSWAFYLGGLSVTMFFNMAFGSTLTDEPCCYKTFDGGFIRALAFRHNGFGWEPEITGKILKLGIRIHEVPVSYHPRKVCENKKIKWTDGLAAFGIGLWERLRPVGRLRNSMMLGVPHLAEFFRRERNYRRWLLGIFLLALALRFCMAIPALEGMPRVTLFRPDTATYLPVAIEDGALADYFWPRCGTADELAASTWRPPLYPLLGGTLFLLFPEAPADAVYRLLAAIGILLGACMVYPAAGAGRLLGGRLTGILSAAFIALNLTAISASPLLLADTLFALLVGFQVFFWVRLWRYRRLFDYGWGILFALLGCLVKPVNLPVVLIVAPFFALLFLRPKWKIALGLAGTAVCFAVIPGAWMFRNQLLGAGFVLDTNTGNTLIHNASAIVAHAEKRSSAEVLPELFKKAGEHCAEAEGLSPAQKLRFSETRKRELYFDCVRKYPASFLATQAACFGTLLPDVPSALENLGKTSSGQGTLSVIRKDGICAGLRHYLGSNSWSTLLPLLPLLAVTVLMYGLCGVELVRRICRRDWRLLLVFAGCSLSYIVLPGPVIMPRYALPALFLIAVFAAGCGADFWNRRLSKKR